MQQDWFTQNAPKQAAKPQERDWFDANAPAAPAPPPVSRPEEEGRGGLANFGLGALKGAGRTVLGSVPAYLSMMFPGINYTPADKARVDKATQPNGTAQKAGFVAESVAESLLPGGPAARAGVAAVPRMARAGQKFQNVMGAARNVPVNVSKPGDVALRIMQLSERGGSMPKAVRDFLKRVTDPAKKPMTYEEGRDFASNISRLSANDYARLTPVMKREIGALRVALNNAVGEAAVKAGRGEEYFAAMREYAQAAKLKGVKDKALRYVIPGGLGLIAADYAIDKVRDALRGGRD